MNQVLQFTPWNSKLIILFNKLDFILKVHNTYKLKQYMETFVKQ